MTLQTMQANTLPDTLPPHIRAILAGRVKAIAPTGAIAQARVHAGPSPLKTRTIKGADIVDAMDELETHDCPVTWVEGEDGGSTLGRATLGGWDW